MEDQQRDLREEQAAYAAWIREHREEWLAEQGAWLGIAEDRFGDTRRGWWLDGVFLGKNARDAVEAIRG